MVEVDFFLLGAPRCGTTSLASWLGAHRHVFFTDPKEPQFFSSDIGSPRAVRDLEGYRQLFRAAGPEHRAVGEGSTTYLRSRVAVPRILEVVPNARFIVCLRNPIDMVRSVHRQLVRTGREPERSFERAWRLQGERRDGRHLPRHCPEPADLQYRDLCSIGGQVHRLTTQVPQDRLHLVLLDDMAAHPAATYRGVLRFLGLGDDGRENFPVHNRGGEPRSLAFAAAMSRLLHLSASWGITVPTGLRRVGVALNERTAAPTRSRARSEVDRELLTAFEDEIQLLARILERDLGPWLEGKVAGVEGPPE